jgi:hypothetical protein
MSKKPTTKGSAKDPPSLPIAKPKQDTVLIGLSSARAISNDPLNDSYVSGSYTDDEDAIYNSFDESQAQEADPVAATLVARLKKKIEAAEVPRIMKDKIQSELQNSEKRTFAKLYLNQPNLHNYFADKLSDDNLMTEVSIMIKASLESKANKISTDIQHSDQALAPRKLDLRTVNKFLKKGYEDDIKFGVNNYKKNFYLVKFEKDAVHPLIKKNERIAKKIKGQEARAFLGRIHVDHENLMKSRGERLEHEESAVKRKAKREKKARKAEKDKKNEVRLAGCKQRIVDKKKGFKEKLAYLREFEDNYRGKYLDGHVPLYKKRGKWAKENKVNTQRRLEENHEFRGKTYGPDEIQKHQELLETLKGTVKHHTDLNAPINHPIPFYNNRSKRALGYEVSTYKNAEFYRKSQDVDELQEKIALEQEEFKNNGYSAAQKEENFVSV